MTFAELRRSIGILAAAVLSSSCATLMDGPRQGITFESIPPGATVHIDGYPDITTPGSVELARERSYAVTIHKDGYHDATVAIDRQFNAATLGNLLLFPIGIVGIAVDANYGSMGHLSPEAVSVTLQDASGPATPASNTASTESPLPPVSALLSSADAGPEVRQSAASAAAGFAALDPYERVELPISVYELHLTETEAQIAGLSFGEDDASVSVRKAIAAILAYHHTARDVRRAKMAALDKLHRDVREAASPVPYLSDSEVSRWVAGYPFLKESLETAPGPGIFGEMAGSWYPDRATELLWEHARADTRELAAWAAGADR